MSSWNIVISRAAPAISCLMGQDSEKSSTSSYAILSSFKSLSIPKSSSLIWEDSAVFCISSNYFQLYHFQSASKAFLIAHIC